MLSVREIKERTESFFRTRGVPNPRLDADTLIARVLGLRRLDLYLDLDRPLPEARLAELRPLVKRRSEREPLQYILGTVPFCGLELRVDARALIPRPETEELCEAVCRRVAATPPARILDLGTGSGALAVAVAACFPDAEVTAVDADAGALALARENARELDLEKRIRFLRGDWYGPVREGAAFDLILANPPYLGEAELRTAEPEVLDYEPAGALVAEEEGLAELRRILDGAASFLAPGGLLALETGVAHHEALAALAEKAGLSGEGETDLSGRPRFFFARKAGADSAEISG